MQNQHSFLLSNAIDSNNSQLDRLNLNFAQNLAQNSLQQFASRSSFDSDIALAFGENPEIDNFKTSWLDREFNFPEIEVVQRAEIGYANGAFSSQTDTIYLSEEFLLTNQNNPNIISNVLLEEYGHFIDRQLNQNDSPGDEGAIFAAMVQGENLSQRQLQLLRGEDDTAIVTLNGKAIEIEQSFTDLINGLGGSGELTDEEGFGENFIPRHDDSLAGETDTDSTQEQSSNESTETDTNSTQEQSLTEEEIEEINEVFEVDLTGIFPNGINYYGENYDRFYINNNGNITFDGPLATFTPTNISSYPIIAPFFADVDTRENNIETSPGGNSQGTNLVYYDVNSDAGEITVTWDDVGKYPSQTIPNAFQLILRSPEEGEGFVEGEGNFQIEFRYEEIQWTVGGASDDVYARVGFSGGNIANFYELPFSNNLEQLLQLEAATNVNQPGRFVFNVIDGEPQVDEDAYSLIPTTTVHRFYEHQKDFYLYSADETEIETIKGRSAEGRQNYEYEYDGEQFRVLTSDKDEFTGETIEGAKPVYRYLNTDTGSYFYTMDDNEMNYIDDNLAHYKRDGGVINEIAIDVQNENEVDLIENNLIDSTIQVSESVEFYAFESGDATELPVIPVYRMFNSQSGTHYWTANRDVATDLESNFPYFSIENNQEPVFYAFEL